MIAVYIASAYTKGDTALNVRAQIDAADQLMGLGYCPIVPLYSHFQQIVHYRPYEQWMEVGLEKVRRCDALLRLPGESPGSDREVQMAEDIGIPVFYSISDLAEVMKK